MSTYRRPKATGAKVFFTVALADRRSDLLVRHVDLLRQSASATRRDHPFGIDAWVVLPDHMHFIWQMPVGDRAYGVRIGAIKARFSMGMRRAGFTPPTRSKTGGHVDRVAFFQGHIGLFHVAAATKLAEERLSLMQHVQSRV